MTLLWFEHENRKSWSVIAFGKKKKSDKDEKNNNKKNKSILRCMNISDEVLDVYHEKLPIKDQNQQWNDLPRAAW